MTDAKHTPAPWSVETGRTPRSRLSDETAWFEITARDAKGNIFVICNRVQMRRPDEVQANAHLIAAAPDLLAACERMRDIIDLDEQEGNWNCTCAPGDTCPGCAVRQAIAKARGGAT